MNATSPLRPVARLVGHGGERADDPVVMDERGDEVAGERRRRRRTALSPWRQAPRGHRGRRGRDRVRRTSPTQPSSRRRSGRSAATSVGEPGPGGDLEMVVAQDADRRGIGAQGAAGLVDDRPEQLLAVVRGGEPLGDAEDGVEPLGELELERPAAGDRRVVARSSASPPRSRRNRDGRAPVGARHAEGPGPGHAGSALAVSLTHAHRPMVAPRARANGRSVVRSRPVRTYQPGRQAGPRPRRGPGLDRVGRRPATPGTRRRPSRPGRTRPRAGARRRSTPGTRPRRSHAMWRSRGSVGEPVRAATRR